MNRPAFHVKDCLIFLIFSFSEYYPPQGALFAYSFAEFRTSIILCSLPYQLYRFEFHF